MRLVAAALVRRKRLLLHVLVRRVRLVLLVLRVTNDVWANRAQSSSRSYGIGIELFPQAPRSAYLARCVRLLRVSYM